MSLPPVTIIILNWNGRLFLDDCLSAVMALEYPRFQTMLIDNHSTDDSVAFVRAHFPEVEVVENEANVGFAAGNNAALRGWEGEIAVLLNPDVTVSPDWLRHLVQPLLDDERIGITGSKLHYPDGHTLQHAGGRLHYPQALPTHDGIREADAGQHDRLRDVEYVIGAALAFKAPLLAAIGLLDEGFFLFYEDVDFCFRARQAGFRVVYVPQAVAVHVESATAGKGSPAYLGRFHTSRWRFLLKHYGVDELLQETIPAEQHWLNRIQPVERTAVMAAYQAARHMVPELVNVPRGRPFSQQQARQLDQALQRLGQLGAQIATAQQPASNPVDPLQSLAAVRETPFASAMPLLGPLVARFRALWNSVATQWYVRPLLQQQNRLNEVLVARLRALESRLVQQDQELTALSEAYQELAARVGDLRPRPQETDENKPTVPE